MSLPVATTISGVDSMQVLEQNLAIARADFSRFPRNEMETLRNQAKLYALTDALSFSRPQRNMTVTGRQQHHFPTAEELPA